jgi:NAD(P)-dependent dehydrogenase (short-subunit alcohol dehydrogenase family)
MPDDEFCEQVVLVTGAGRGIGRAIAEAFAARGARVAANDVTPINLDVTLQRIQAAGGQAKDYVFDVGKQMPVRSMVEQVLADWGRIDVLINNAAVQPRAALLEMDEWDWRRTLDVNLSGPFFTMQQVGRAMRQHGGAIVNLAAALERTSAWQERAAFVASKAGLIGLTRQAADELAVYHIRVNAVCPAWIAGDWPNSQNPLPPEAVPLGRAGSTADVVALVLFLCSAAAAYITGQVIGVDGGWTVR